MLSSLRKTFHNIRRATSSERQTTGIRPFVPTEDPMTPKKKVPGLSKVDYALIQRFTDGSRLVQMKRTSTATPFGIFIASDSKGLFISRKGDQEYLSGCEKLIRVGDRVLKVQGAATKGLNVSTIHGLIQGCHVVTMRLKPHRRCSSGSSR